MVDVRIKQEPTYVIRLSAPEMHALHQAVERVVTATEGRPDGWRKYLVEVHRALQDAPFPLEC